MVSPRLITISFHKWGGFFAGLAALAWHCPDALGANLFVNADMENCPLMPHNTPPTGWGNSSTSLGADCEYWATGTDPGLHLGTRSPRLQYSHFEGITQTVPTTPGQTYWVGFYIAGNGGFGEIRFNAYNGTTIASVPIVAGYTLVSGSFMAATTMTTIYLGANLTSNATGDARIDDACLASSPGQCNGMAGVCGDGFLETSEICDDGNTVNGDGCDNNCTKTECGNGITSTGEMCDDGNIANGDGCDSNCTPTACGNGITTMGEVCDDGNVVNGDGCDSNCTFSECGNGIATIGEGCDDGNITNGDGCDSNCTPTACGNGITTMGEVCDDGNVVNGDGCNSTCLSNEACGNGFVDADEACDDGNTVDGDGCSAKCSSKETCGNGTLDAPAGEECDDGNAVDGDGCQANCKLPVCGDKIKDSGEVCDDGNTQSGDGCNAMCSSDETCGNGILDTAAGEACDDANTKSGDGCQANCALPSCGDGAKDTNEVCDDGNTQSGDGCNATCTSDESCGNGILDSAAEETCDDANTVSGDGCESNCKLPAAPGTPNTTEEGSCDCHTVGNAPTSPRGFVWTAVMLGLAGMWGRRRRSQ